MITSLVSSGYFRLDEPPLLPDEREPDERDPELRAPDELDFEELDRALLPRSAELRDFPEARPMRSDIPLLGFVFLADEPRLLDRFTASLFLDRPVERELLAFESLLVERFVGCVRLVEDERLRCASSLDRLVDLRRAASSLRARVSRRSVRRRFDRLLFGSAFGRSGDRASRLVAVASRPCTTRRVTTRLVRVAFPVVRDTAPRRVAADAGATRRARVDRSTVRSRRSLVFTRASLDPAIASVRFIRDAVLA